MLAVIFRATVAQTDDRYLELAERLRQLAFDKYGCRDFIAFGEGDQELTISYWDNEEQIRAWKQDAEHRVAQELGRTTWYAQYQVQIAQIVRSYGTHTGS